MRPGPPKKPTALKLIAGNPGGKKLPKGEATPPASMPTMPGHLGAEARAEWQRLAPMLVQLGLLSTLDRTAFAAYCQAWAHHVEAEEMLASSGTTMTTSNGQIIVSPWMRVSRQAVETLARLLGEFGLTPAARTRINTTPPHMGGDFEF